MHDRLTRIVILIVPFWFILNLPIHIQAQVDQVEVDERAAQIDRLMQGYAKYRSFSGSILVAERGRVVYQESFGLANRVWNISNDNETRYSIASVTKPFTAALILRLVDQNLLSLSDCVTDILKDYRADTGRQITIHHLLTHSSGLPNSIGTKAFWEGNGCRLDYTKQEFVRRFCSGDLLFEPGARARYSDANYYLLALVSEQVTGTGFGQSLSEHVLIPIGATNSGVIRKKNVVDRLASGYIRFGEAHTHSVPINYEDTQLGAGDMYATIGDLVRFDRALYEARLLSRESQELMFTDHGPTGFANMRSGYGWNLGTIALRDSGRRLKIQHAPGNNGGFSAVLFRVPEEQQVIVLVQNTGPSHLDNRIFTICSEVVHALSRESIVAPPTGMVDVLGFAARHNGPSSIKMAFDEHQKPANSLPWNVRGINRLGYELLREQRVEAAIEVFKLNVNSAPDNFNAYDSLAQAYMTQGQNDLAIMNYQKSLDLNPNNQNAINMLKQLKANE